MICNATKHLTFPRKLDSTTRDFITQLLTINPALRLGGGADGANAIKEHEWFTWDGRFTFDDLCARTYTAPFVPVVKNSFDVSNFDEYPPTNKVNVYKDPGDGAF